MAGGLEVNVADVGDNILVSCDGDLDLATADRFRHSADLVVALHPDRLHLDCGGVEFIDASGVRAMMKLASDCHQRGIAFTVSTNDAIERVFDRAGVKEFFSPPR